MTGFKTFHFVLMCIMSLGICLQAVQGKLALESCNCVASSFMVSKQLCFDGILFNHVQIAVPYVLGFPKIEACQENLCFHAFIFGNKFCLCLVCFRLVWVSTIMPLLHFLSKLFSQISLLVGVALSMNFLLWPYMNNIGCCIAILSVTWYHLVTTKVC